jgi:hypothetical protein
MRCEVIGLPSLQNVNEGRQIGHFAGIKKLVQIIGSIIHTAVIFGG